MWWRELTSYKMKVKETYLCFWLSFSSDKHIMLCVCVYVFGYTPYINAKQASDDSRHSTEYFAIMECFYIAQKKKRFHELVTSILIIFVENNLLTLFFFCTLFYSSSQSSGSCDVHHKINKIIFHFSEFWNKKKKQFKNYQPLNKTDKINNNETLTAHSKLNTNKMYFTIDIPHPIPILAVFF